MASACKMATTAGMVIAAMVLLIAAPALADGPVQQKVKSISIKAPLLWNQPSSPDAKPKTATVKVFPGVKFYSTFCGGPNVDRTGYIDKLSIAYTQNRGPSGNSLQINYFFASAKLEVYITETYKGKVLYQSSAWLSALLDRSSDKQIQNFAAAERKAAISALNTLITHFDKFSNPNQEAACMAYLKSSAKNPYQPYSPDLGNTLSYLKTVRDTLAKLQ